MTGSKDFAVPYTPATMKQIIIDALSPSSQDSGPEPGSVDDRPRQGRLNDPSLPEDDIQTDELSSSPPHPISPTEHFPLLFNASRNTPGLAYHASPMLHANSPSPLRNVINLNDLAAACDSSPLRNRSTVLSSPLPRRVPAPEEVACSSSPIRATNSPNKTYEVEASFLQAMIGLLERQANIVPEHLFTQADVERIVRNELEIEKPREQDKTRTHQLLRVSSYLPMSGILTATASGAAVEVFRRARLVNPERLGWFMDGLCKGAASGFLGAVIIKGILWAVDRIRGEENNG